MKYGIIGYEYFTEAMVFGQHYKITENGKWIKTKMSRKEFLEKCFLKKREK